MILEPRLCLALEIQPSFVRDVQLESPEISEIVKKRRGTAMADVSPLSSRVAASGNYRRDSALKPPVASSSAPADALINLAKLAELGLSPQEAYSGA